MFQQFYCVDQVCSSNTSYIYKGLVLLKNLDLTELICFSKLSFTGSQSQLCLRMFSNRLNSDSSNLLEAYSEPCSTCRMQRFAKIAHGSELLAITQNTPSQMFDWVMNTSRQYRFLQANIATIAVKMGSKNQLLNFQFMFSSVNFMANTLKANTLLKFQNAFF